MLSAEGEQSTNIILLTQTTELFSLALSPSHTQTKVGSRFLMMLIIILL